MAHWILAVIIAAMVFVFGLTAWNHSEAVLIEARARAEAIVIKAEAAAQATVILALVPWGIILGLAVPATILAAKFQPRQPQMLQKEVHFIIEPGQPRRVLWQTLEATKGETKEIILQRGRFGNGL
jgi:hypothetical protein